MDIEKYAGVQKVAKDVLEELKNHIFVTSTEQEIANKAKELMADSGVTETWYHSVPAFVLLGNRSCLSISGRDYIPSNEVVGLENLVTVDLSPSINNIWGDCARSFIVEEGQVIDQPKNKHYSEGIEMECFLHHEMKEFVTLETTFEQLFFFGNNLISKNGWLNLDFNGNLGHSIETSPDKRRYIEKNCSTKLSEVKLFTFEPHIRRKNEGIWGFKHENIYYFNDSGIVKVL